MEAFDDYKFAVVQIITRVDERGNSYQLRIRRVLTHTTEVAQHFCDLLRRRQQADPHLPCFEGVFEVAVLSRPISVDEAVQNLPSDCCE